NKAVNETSETIRTIADQIAIVQDIQRNILQLNDAMSSQKDRTHRNIASLAASIEQHSASNEQLSASAVDQLDAMSQLSQLGEQLQTLASSLEESVKKFR
ncbi:MAG: hypothetical protein ACRC5C_05505, partial [Bacilli bacterium]